jgi:hypothetical protein
MREQTFAAFEGEVRQCVRWLNRQAIGLKTAATKGKLSSPAPRPLARVQGTIVPVTKSGAEC